MSNGQQAGRRKWIAGLVVLLIGIGIFLAGRRQKPELKVAVLDGSTATVVPGVHLIGGLGPAAAYVVETTDGLVLFDTGLESDAQALKSEITKLGLDGTKLKAIFLTHVHGDHCGGAERLRDETGARVYAGKADAPMLVAGGPRDAFFSTFKMPGHAPHPTTIDVILEGAEAFNIGGVRIQILNTPGHTAGSTCYLVEKSGLRILVSGDVIFRLGDKPLGTYSTYLAPRYGGDAKAYLESLRRLKSIAVPDLILPGHPRASRSPQSPQLSQEAWDEMLDNGIAEMERLARRFQSDGANFLDGQPKQLLKGLFYLGDFDGSAVYAIQSSSKLFVVDAPRGPGLNEFLKTQLRQLDVTIAEPVVVLLTACGEKETAGLRELVERTNAQVVVAPEGRETIEKLCPPGTTILSTDELADKAWLTVSTILLPGPGLFPTAYLLTCEGKRILISGRIPPLPETTDGLDIQSAETKEFAVTSVNSIRRLSQLKPDLWLPAIPVDAQNANLYEGAWNGILEKSFRFVSEFLPRR